MYNHENTYDYGEKIGREIRFLTKSKVRMEILISLYDTPNNISGIHEKTHLNYSSITSNLNKLEENEYIFKEDGLYYLETHTRLKLINLLLLNNNLDFIYEYSNFFNNHLVKNDNLQALGTLPFVKNSKLIQTDNINPFVATETIEEAMMKEGQVKCICIYLHPNCSAMIEVMMNQRSAFEVIVPPSFAYYIKYHAMEYKTDKPLLNICFDVKPLENIPLRIALVVSQQEIVIGLVKKEGIFNKNCCLRSEDESARWWGYQVYREFESLKPGHVDIREIVRKNNNLKE